MTGTRLNDCDLAPGEKAKYDAEREAQIARAKLYIRSDRYVSNPTKPPPRTQDFIAWLDAALAALEEARTEATVVMEQLRKTCAEILGTDTDWPNYALTVTELDGKRREVAEALARLRADAGDTEVNYARELSRMKAEIARLRAPPAADVMELARSLLDFTGYPPPNQTKKEWIEECVARVARALTTYGDQRARDARQQILVDSTPLREAVAHEARAAAWAEAILMVDDETHITHNFPAPPIIAKMRERALAAAPPQSEERHLTPDEQRVMQKALLRSTRIIDDPPQSEGGEG
jgi:hypothetical protein